MVRMLRQVETRQVWGCQLGVAPRDRGSSEREPKSLAHLQALLNWPLMFQSAW